jgi:CRISPR-associated protein (TIGR03986 family)
MEPLNGILRLKSNGRLQIVDANGKEYRIANELRDLAPGLLERSQAGTADGLEVTFEYTKGTATFVRWLGQGRAAPPVQATAAPIRSSRARSFNEFANPYGFVPALPRAGLDGDLGDHAPTSLETWSAGGVSGRLVCEFTVATPLVLSGRKREVGGRGHFVYRTRTVRNRAYFAPSSIKGPLRAAYEAITNSRYGVLNGDQHKNRLGFRMATTDARQMVPVRVNGDKLELLTGVGNVGDMERPNPTVYGALLPVYAQTVTEYPNNFPAHGSQVTAELELVQHSNKRGPDFKYWRVAKLWTGDPATTAPLVVAPVGVGERHRMLQDRRTTTGWIYVSNRNMGNKHDERLFFYTGTSPKTVPLTTALREQYRETVASYRSLHSYKEIHGAPKSKRRAANPGTYLGREPGQTAWSAHIYDDSRKELTDGSLCYAQFGPGGTLRGLYPVTISRGIHARSPWSLVDRLHTPATSIDEMSPADRLFGWVSDGSPKSGPAAVRGRLRIRHVTMPTDCIEKLPAPTPLAILGQPKPQQGRFYAGVPLGATTVKPLESGASRSSWFTEDKVLRGRKMYPHHAGLPEGYWDTTVPPGETVGDRYQEYRRAPEADTAFVNGKQRTKIVDGAIAHKAGSSLEDDQNRSIADWIKPGTSFKVEIDVHDVSLLELGALIWLLDLPEGAHHRFGYGKPLGFGSIRVTLNREESALTTGEGMQRRLLQLDRHRPSVEGLVDSCLQSFRETIAANAKTSSPESTSILQSFLKLATGDPGLAVHYPRVRPDGLPQDVPVSPSVPAYKWFVENERPNAEQRSLPVGFGALDILDEQT